MKSDLKGFYVTRYFNFDIQYGLCKPITKTGKKIYKFILLCTEQSGHVRLLVNIIWV